MNLDLPKYDDYHRLLWGVIMQAIDDAHSKSLPWKESADGYMFLTERTRIEPFLNILGVSWFTWKVLINKGLPRLDRSLFYMLHSLHSTEYMPK